MRLRPSLYNYKTLRFDETLLKKHYQSVSGRRINFIVVHHMTILENRGKALSACYRTWQTRKASAHYGVEGKRVRRFVKDKNIAWATGSNRGNLNGISIEHANSTAGPKWLVGDQTKKTGAKLAAALHIYHKLGYPTAGRTMFRHSDFVATACPGPDLGDKYWNSYVKETQRQYKKMKGV